MTLEDTQRLYVLLGRIAELAAEGIGMSAEEVVAQARLLELPSAGRPFTWGEWCNGQPVDPFDRLCLALCQSPEAMVPLLVRLSDAGLAVVPADIAGDQAIRAPGELRRAWEEWTWRAT